MAPKKKKPKWLKWILEFLDKLSPTEWYVAGAFLISIISSFWSPVRAILTYAIDVAILPLLIFTLAPLVIALSVSIIHRRRNSGKQRFRVIDILTPDLPIELLWRMKRPIEEWIDTNTNAVHSSYLATILDGPFCGKSTGKGKYCRSKVSAPPRGQYHRDLWRVYWRCTVCNAGMDDQETRDRYIDLDELRKGVIEALQRHVQNGGKVRDKMVLSFID